MRGDAAATAAPDRRTCPPARMTAVDPRPIRRFRSDPGALPTDEQRARWQLTVAAVAQLPTRACDRRAGRSWS